MNLRKFISGVSALAIAASAFASMAVTASAAAGDPVTIKPKWDVQLDTKNKVQTGGTLRVDKNGNNDYVSALRFEIPATPDGKVIDSVSLRLVTNYIGTSGQEVKLYSFAVGNNWTGETMISYGESTSGSTSRYDVTDLIAAARATAAIGSFNVKGQGGRSIYGGHGDVGADYLTLDKWLNNVSIDVSAVAAKTSGYFDFILSSEGTYQNRFYSKDQESDIEIGGSGKSDITVKADDLKPQLTITYKDDVKPVSIGETGYDSFDAAINAAQSGDTITLHEDITLQSGKVIDPASGVTITSDANGPYTITGATDKIAAVNLTTNNKVLTIDNVNIAAASNRYAIQLSNNTTLNLKNMTINGTIYQNNGKIHIYFDNTIVNGHIQTRLGRDQKQLAATADISLTNGSVVNQLTYLTSTSTFTDTLSVDSNSVVLTKNNYVNDTDDANNATSTTTKANIFTATTTDAATSIEITRNDGAKATPALSDVSGISTFIGTLAIAVVDIPEGVSITSIVLK